jgi:hypothetical protein
MSRQFALHATAIDLREMARKIGELGPPFDVVYRHRPHNACAPRADLETARSLKVGMVLKDQIGDLRWETLDNERELLNFVTSPVIEALRPYFDGQEMSRGRLFYTNSFYDDDRQKVSKSSEFLGWAAQVFKLVKKTFVFDLRLDSYVGSDARLWMEEVKSYDIAPTGRVVAHMNRHRVDPGRIIWDEP